MSMKNTKVGETLPISLQIFDGNENLYPRAEIKNASGSLLSVVNLSHVGKGLYINRSFLMPDNPIVTAQYKVYEDAAFTILLNEDEYQDDLDVFVRQLSESSLNVSDGTIEGIVSDDDEVYGLIEDGANDGVLLGEVDSDELTGFVIEENLLVGLIDNDSLVGVVEFEEA